MRYLALRLMTEGSGFCVFSDGKDEILIGQSIVLRYDVKNQAEACEDPWGGAD